MDKKGFEDGMNAAQNMHGPVRFILNFIFTLVDLLPYVISCVVVIKYNLILGVIWTIYYGGQKILIAGIKTQGFKKFD